MAFSTLIHSYASNYRMSDPFTFTVYYFSALLIKEKKYLSVSEIIDYFFYFSDILCRPLPYI